MLNVGDIVDHSNDAAYQGGLIIAVHSTIDPHSVIHHYHVKWPNGGMGVYQDTHLIDRALNKALARAGMGAAYIPQLDDDMLGYEITLKASFGPKCECGAHKTVNSNCHADWCQLSPHYRASID